MTESTPKYESKKTRFISRRDFLKLSALTAAGITLVACSPKSTQGTVSSQARTQDLYPEVPYAPPEPPPTVLQALTKHEAETIEAAVARIYPGTPANPGAREAGVTNFIDKMLAFRDGTVEPVYVGGPHMKTYDTPEPPAQKSDEHGPIIWVKKSEAERYGTQSPLSPLARYQAGVKSLDEYSNEKMGADFSKLKEDQQDTLLVDMKDDKATHFEDPTGKQFFDMLQQATIQGMFSDPAYGGNKDMVGWKEIGYPGAQRAYTPVELTTEGPVRPPQSLAMLHRFHAGMQSSGGVIVPPSGSQETPNP